MLKRRS